MSEGKKKMKRSTFLLILCPIMALLVGGIIAVSCIMEYWSIVMNQVFGGPSIVISEAEGTENWNSDYYDKKSGSKEAADSAAERLAITAQEEGLVLLKNKDNALPFKNVSSTNRLKVNAFGWSFYYPANGGAGAGAIGKVDTTPKSAFAEVGIEINNAMEQQYIGWSEANKFTKRPSGFGPYPDWTVPEMNSSEFDSAYNSAQASANDVSFVWLGRSGGEGADLPRSMSSGNGVKMDADPSRHYLQTTNNEDYIINKLVAEKKAGSKIIIFLNSPAPMELGALADNDGIDAIVWVGNPGNKGYKGIANVLVGAANPSGRLPDTYAADFLSSPTMQNFSDPNIYIKGGAAGGFADIDEIMVAYDKHLTYNRNGNQRRRNVYYTAYEEGIYMGYRWYETAADAGYFTSDNLPEGETDKYYNRDNGVIYPFGAGLSYTTFEQKITKHKYSNGVFSFEVNVKNTGNVAGKEVVQLYVETPYTSGGIEKSKVVLAAFGKTQIIDAGKDVTVSLSVKAEDIASYDDVTEKAYVLDKGAYTFYLSNAGGVNYGSHGWAHKTADSHVTFTDEFNRTVFNESNPRDSEKFAHNELGVNYKAATNVFEENLRGNNMKVKNGGMTMSRTSLSASFPTAPTAADKVMSDELKGILDGNVYDTKAQVEKHNNAGDVMPLVGQNHGIDLASMRGKSYDDPAWDKFVEQFTVAELAEFVEKSGWTTAAVERVGKPMTNDNDGPQALKVKALGGGIEEVVLVAFPCEVVLAATWNVELLEQIGKAIGEEGSQYGVNGWYAPGLNMHRSPFSGRNFEYFSEDPVLAGKLCAAEISGAASKGLYAYVKHFFLNDQESYARNLNAGKAIDDLNPVTMNLDALTDCILMTWATEQTMREVYLKAFEIVFKEARADVQYLDSNGNVKVKENAKAATAVMTSFNCVGNTWAGGDYNLITQVLRNEWGFEGLVLTDSVRTHYMYSDQMLRAGGDACLMSYAITLQDKESASAIKEMQRAAKNLCYTVAHSNAMSFIAPGSKISYTLAPWELALLLIGIFIGLLVAGGVVWIVLRIRDEKKNPSKYKS